MKLRNRLRELRGDRTQAAVAAETGIAQSNVAHLELGRMLPRDEWLPALEDAYGLPFNEIYEIWAAGSGGRMLVELDEDG